LEEDILLVVSEHVVAELAASLGLDEAGVRAAVKKGKPVVVEARPVRPLPKPPTLQNAEFFRSLWLSGKAIVGEGPEREEDVLKVPVKSGPWHAYLYDREADDRDRALEGLLLVHADHCNQRVADIHIDVGGVGLDGATIGVLDSAALSDDPFGVDEVERLRRAQGGYFLSDRGLEVSTGRDGDHRVLVNNHDAATGIFVVFWDGIEEDGDVIPSQSGFTRLATHSRLIRP
jgi:hypothetical protein